MKVFNFNQLPFEEISQKIKSGKKLRFDIGTSKTAPFSSYWHSNLKDIISISVEPNPDCVETVHENVKNFHDHYHIVGAIDNVDEFQNQPFYVTTIDVGCSSLLQPDFSNPGFAGYSLSKIINVETFSLKMLLDKIDYEFIELIKSDTQGKDLDVIKSLKNHLQNVCYIDVEDDHTSFYKNASTHDEILDFFALNGFELYKTLKHGQDSLLQDLRFINKMLKIPEKFNNKSRWKK